MADERATDARLRTDEVLAGLLEHRRIHQLWLEHLEHCVGCEDCAADVVKQVGSVETHRAHVAFYDQAIAWVRAASSVPATPLLTEVGESLAKAEAKHAPMHGAHEGYAVILEELDELWDEVRAWQPTTGADGYAKMRKEALHVAAMALRFVKDVCDSRPPVVSPTPHPETTDEQQRVHRIGESLKVAARRVHSRRAHDEACASADGEPCDCLGPAPTPPPVKETQMDNQALLRLANAGDVSDYGESLEVLPDSLGRPLAARIRLLLEAARRESHLAVLLRQKLQEVAGPEVATSVVSPTPQGATK